MRPFVTVVIPTYNRAHILSDAVNSVLEQDFQDLEVLVVDDGSSDNTYEEVVGIDDQRVRYVYQQNAGLATARNTGIAQAAGKYVAFLDDDDLLTAGSIASRVAFLEANPHVGWVSGGFDIVNETGSVIAYKRPWLSNPDLSLKTWLYWCPTCPSAVMVTHDWLERVGSFDIEQGLQEDWDLWLRLAYAGCLMDWVPKVACHYRIHSTNMTRNSKAIHAENGLLRVLDKFFSQENLESEILNLRASVYAHSYLKLAAAAFSAGDVQTALRDVDAALARDASLASNNGEAVLDFLLGYVRSPLIENPLYHARFVMDHLPDERFLVKRRRRKALGKVAAGLFFSAAELRDWNAVKKNFPIMVVHDPSWLANLGVWSIMRNAILNSG